MAEQMQHYRFTVEEYHRMGEVGIIAADSRVELIGGQIVVMSPISDPNFKCVNRYNEQLMTLPLRTWQVSVQNPIRLSRVRSVIKAMPIVSGTAAQKS